MKAILMTLFAALFAISAASSFAATTAKAAQGTIVVADEDSGNSQAPSTDQGSSTQQKDE